MDYPVQSSGMARFAPGTPLAGAAPRPLREGLRLVTSTLRLATTPGAAVPGDWDAALHELMAAHAAELAWVSAQRQVPRWRPADQGQALLFAPWHCWTPADLQARPGRTAGLPGQWLAGYLFDCGLDRPASRPVIDLMVLSPQPAACLDDDCGYALPRVAPLAEMLAAARREERSRIAIITPARAVNAMARRVLASERGARRTGVQLAILAIEEALGALMAGAPAWDALIVLPDLRGIVCAILAEATGLAGPWPLAFHDGSLRMITAESFRPAPSPHPLDAALLVQSLALAARHVGMDELSRALIGGWVRLRDHGVATATRGAAAPYATILSEAEFLARIPAASRTAGRRVPHWRALDAEGGNDSPHSPVDLSLVASR